MVSEPLVNKQLCHDIQVFCLMTYEIYLSKTCWAALINIHHLIELLVFFIQMRLFGPMGRMLCQLMPRT